MTDTDPAPSAIPLRELRTSQHLAISTYWAGTNFLLGALLLALIPLQIRDMVDVKSSGSILGMLISLGAIPALAIPLIVGPLSDRSMSRVGRRRPYILAGTLLAIVGIITMYAAGELSLFWLYFAGYFVLQVGVNTGMAAFSGIIPDLVPQSQRGLASGFMAVMSQVGTLAGVVSCSLLASQKQYLMAYSIIVIILSVALVITMLGVKETPLSCAPPKLSWKAYFKSLWIDPRKYPDFAWVWITRALVMLGFYALMPFLAFYLSDVIRVKDVGGEVAKLTAIVIVFSAISAIFGGRLSDRYGRKKFVYWANGGMAAMCLGFTLCNTMPAVLAVGILFGLAYGTYISVDWALGTDVLPNPDDAAKDMAVWHVSMTLPQSIAAWPAGLLLGAFGVTAMIQEVGVRQLHVFQFEALTVSLHYTEMGFDWLFISAAACLSLGALLLRNVKGVR